MSDKKGVDLDRFRKLIDESEFVRDEISKEIGCDTSTITKHYNGDRTITAEFVIKYARFFNVSADYLLGLSDTPTTDLELKAICDYTGLNEESVKELNYLSKDNKPKIVALNFLIGKDKSFIEHISLFLLSNYICEIYDISLDYDIPTKIGFSDILYDEDVSFSRVIKSLPLIKEGFRAFIDETAMQIIDKKYVPKIIDFKKCEVLINDYFYPGLNEKLNQEYYNEHYEEIAETLFEKRLKEEAEEEEKAAEQFEKYQEKRMQIMKRILEDYRKYAKEGEPSDNACPHN